MARPSQPEPHLIYEAAETFAIAADIIGASFTASEQNPNLLFACMANNALAIELYLKTILAAEGNPRVGHDLHKLFLGLKGKTRKVLSDRYGVFYNEKEILRATDPEKMFGPGGSEFQKIAQKGFLTHDLKEAKDAHVSFRYFFEKGATGYNLGKFTGVIRDYILETYRRGKL